MKQWWKKAVRNYFTFSSGERNGLIVLLIAILLAVFYPQVISLFHKDEPQDFSSFKKEIDSFRQGITYARTDSANTISSLSELDRSGNNKSREVISSPVTLFSFDPNTATAADFKKLGLKEKLVNTILNYRTKGGKFFVQEDFKKIYGLEAQDYARLAPYIQIASQKKYSSNAAAATTILETHSKSSLLDLNQADSLQLDELPMIGAVLSSRILKFRNKLGGFYSADQLKEVYGITPETFDVIKEKVFADSSAVKKISINTITLDELKQHPYFKSVAVVIMNYRNQHGAFKQTEDLKNIDVITENQYQKMRPYIKLNE